MLIVDDILLFPFRGLFWVFHELNNAALREIAAEAESITAELSELYMMLETGRITETEFDAREKELLDQLEETKDRGAYIREEEIQGNLQE